MRPLRPAIYKTHQREDCDVLEVISERNTSLFPVSGQPIAAAAAADIASEAVVGPEMDAVMTSPAAWMEPNMEVDKLSYEIFSILESKFLFDCDDRNLFFSSPPRAAPSGGADAVDVSGRGKVRVLSIDASHGGLFAGAALVRLEAALRKQSGDPAARIADFFDLAAGSGCGGVLAALLFTRGPDGRPLSTAADALRFLAKNRSRLAAGKRKGRLLSGLLCRSTSGGVFRRVFGDATLRDTLKPVLVPCYDLAKGAPFVFSRADAVEADAYDFLLEEVCAATCADPAAGASAVDVQSVDGLTRIRAVGGGVAMGNPTAAAITHVLNNRHEFPSAAGVDDLIVVSIGGGDPASLVGVKSPSQPSAAELVKIAGGAQADTVDQAVAMAFGDSRTTNYVRIQGCGVIEKTTTVEEALSGRGVESVLFRGRKLSERSIGEKLDWFAGEVIREGDRRKKLSLRPGAVPTVVIKSAMTPSRSSSATFTTTSSSVTSASGSL